MDLILEPNDLLFFAGRAVLLVGAFLVFAVALGRWRRSNARDMQRLFAELAQSRTETRAVAAAAEGLFQRLTGLENKLDTRAQLTSAGTNAPRGYELALRLARNGSNVDEISESSGVTHREAELLVRLHGPRRTA